MSNQQYKMLKQVRHDIKCMFSVLTDKINKSLAFTLAEVLITLGIIGVVAALTIPSLLTNINKSRTQTKVAKFYSSFNQALRLSISENGDFTSITRDKNYSYNEMKDFNEKYILPYFQVSRMYDCNHYEGKRRSPCLSLMDGSVVAIHIDAKGGDIDFLPNGVEVKHPTRDLFVFQFSKYDNSADKNVKSTDMIEPYTCGWSGNKRTLLSGSIYSCSKSSSKPAFCTKLLQLNGWKFPKDYPW